VPKPPWTCASGCRVCRNNFAHFGDEADVLRKLTLVAARNAPRKIPPKYIAVAYVYVYAYAYAAAAATAAVVDAEITAVVDKSSNLTKWVATINKAF
jgi:hypothetical protein